MNKSSDKRLKKLKYSYIGIGLLAIFLGIVLILEIILFDSWRHSNLVSVIEIFILSLFFIALVIYFKYHWERLGKEGFGIFLIEDVFLVLIAGLIILFFIQKEWLLLVITLIFFHTSILFEDLIRFNFLFKPKKKRLIKTLFSEIFYGFLWVHATVYFIDKNYSSIYNIEKIGYLPMAISHFIIFIYMVIVYLIYDYTNFSLLIYLIPVISNVYYLHKFNYAVRVKK